MNMMRKILVSLILLVSFYSTAQYSPTGTKTRFVNGISLGTKLDGSLSAQVDSNALWWRADSALMGKYKGAAFIIGKAGTNGAFINNQTGSVLSAQTAKFRISDTIWTSGVIRSGLEINGASGAFIANFDGIKVSGSGAGAGGVVNILQGSTETVTGTGYTSIYARGDTALRVYFPTSNRVVSFGQALTANRFYTLPNASGTIALTSDITGGTLAASFTTVTGTLLTAAQPNITSVGTLSSLSVTGMITSAGGVQFQTTANSGDAFIGRRSAQGLFMQSATGTSYDAALLNPGGGSFIWRIPTGTINTDFLGYVMATDLRISALNTAPATAASTGTTGEIRFVNGFIYLCVATNTWQRVAIATW